MSQEGVSQINGLLITGLLAILGTVTGGIVNGCVDANLAEQKFQTELIIKALESSDRHERTQSLRFLIKTNLVSRNSLSTGIQTYLQNYPDEIPQMSKILRSHEFAFYSNEEIMNLTQSEADSFCVKKFDELKTSGNLNLDPGKVVHKWGHLQGGFCIANLNL